MNQTYPISITSASTGKMHITDNVKNLSPESVRDLGLNNFYEIKSFPILNTSPAPMVITISPGFAFSSIYLFIAPK